MNERPPSLPLPSPIHQHQLQHQGYSSATASPRVGSFVSSSSSSDIHSQSSYTTLASSHGPKTPPASHPVASSVLSSSLQTPLISGYEQYNHQHQHQHQHQHSQSSTPHHAMNQSSADMYYQQSHMNSGQAPPPPVSSGGMPQYNPHQQPTLLQPVPAQYPNPTQYNQYGYSNGLTSPPSAAPVASQMGNPHVLPLPGVSTQQSMQNNYSGFDNTGQVAPPGMKPRVTATLWEDEGSLCFQVEARGICVARREDNHMINGTKLLNVAGMTRGRRDGILKSEKIRHVVKIGPMHLKGVWIPFERALDFANKEKITELLFPLFVHNIAALLYHPTNQNRTNQVMAAAERRKQEQNQLRNGSTPGLPSLQHHTGMALPGPQQTLPSHANMTTPGRSSLDRAHTFPTPPTSASGVMGGNMSASESFQWPQQNVNGTPANPMSIDTSLSNARSMPATPATTPPGPPMQTMPYQSSNQGYDTSRSMYHHQTPAPSSQHTPSQQQTPHHSQSQQGQNYPSSAPNSSPQDRNNLYGHNAAAAAVAAASGYVKNEIPGTGSSRTASIAGPSSNEPVNVDHKATNGLLHSHNGHSNGVHDDEHEHEAEYTHDSGAYDANRTQYNYSAQAPQVTALSNEHSHLSPDVSGASSSHQAAAGASSGRSTPRSAAASQPYAYTQQGYSTPPRGSVPGSAAATATAAAAQASSNLYNVVTNDRGNTNGAAQDVYATGPTDMAALPGSYTTQSLNGTSPPSGIKRGRDDDDDDRSSTDQKRRRTLMEPVMPPSVYDATNTMNRVTATPVGARRHV